MRMQNDLLMTKPRTHVRNCLVPLLWISCFLAPLVMLIGYTNSSLGGSCEKLYLQFMHKGFFSTLYTIWQPCFFGTSTAWKILITFVCSACICIKILPGKRFYNEPAVSDGTLSISKANGLAALLILSCLFLCGSHLLKLFPPTIIYDNFVGLLGTLSAFSVFLWFLSYAKEKWAPSIKWHLNIFTICRFAMIGWAIAILSFASKQYALYGLSDSMIVCSALQFLFVVKFFVWEIGYLRALDITYDRAGLCLCWGISVWIPAIYSSPTFYLVQHPHHLGLGISSALFFCGIGCIFINFLVDRQREYVRDKKGDCLVWRKKPELIFANYRTEWGEEKQSVLLVSGWWGISRHFHYIPELLGAAFWSVPALFNHFLPYFYLCFLTLLLIDRAYRHERRCAVKYGKDWEKYCEKVPFRIIPFIY